MELGAKLAPKARAAFSGLGEGALSALKNWWKSAAKSPAEIEAILNPSSINDALRSAAEASGPALERLNSELRSGARNILKTFTNKASEARSLRSQIGIGERSLIGRERSLELLERDPELAANSAKQFKYHAEKSAVDSARDLIEKDKLRLEQLDEEVEKAQEFKNILENQGVEPAIKYLDQNERLMIELPHLGDWKEEALGKLGKWHQEFKATSENLNKSKSFLKELGEVMSRPADDPYRIAFMNNPENRNYLSSLRGSSSKIAKMIRDIEAPSKEVPRQGLATTLKDWAKKLGVGAATMGIGTAAYKLYDWFHSNPPHNFASQAQKISEDLRELTLFGREGRNIVEKVEASLNKIAQIQDQVNHDLGNDPEKATQKYVSELTAELNTISDAVGEWSTVEQYSEDGEKAEAVGKELAGFLTHFNVALQGLGRQLGVSIGAVKNQGVASVVKDDVEKVQRLLNQEGFEIPVSGKVDEHTLSALRALERRYSPKQLGRDISGAFVNGNQIISYEDLKKALKILENQ